MSILLSSNAQWVLISTMLLGIAAGLIGTLSYWKKQSLMSDALAHACLPGIVIAFFILGEKNLPVLLIGAAISGLIGALCIQWIRAFTRIKDDTAMGMILSVFFGLGIMLLTIANRMPGGNQSGLGGFIFGQAAAMVKQDVYTMSILALVVIAAVILPFKEWKLFLFDPDFAQGLGLPIKALNGLYTVLVVMAVVVGIQAVGVILIAAMLIIPAVSARYWTHSFKWMMVLSALFGGAAGAVGTIISALGEGWPTGPFIIVTVSAMFLFSLLFGLEKGLLVQYIQHRRQKRAVSPDPVPPDWGISTKVREG
jgi:manganese/zinc/iron transport system permease protein